MRVGNWHLQTRAPAPAPHGSGQTPALRVLGPEVFPCAPSLCSCPPPTTIGTSTACVRRSSSPLSCAQGPPGWPSERRSPGSGPGPQGCLEPRERPGTQVAALGEPGHRLQPGRLTHRHPWGPRAWGRKGHLAPRSPGSGFQPLLWLQAMISIGRASTSGLSCPCKWDKDAGAIRRMLGVPPCLGQGVRGGGGSWDSQGRGKHAEPSVIPWASPHGVHRWAAALTSRASVHLKCSPFRLQPGLRDEWRRAREGTRCTPVINNVWQGPRPSCSSPPRRSFCRGAPRSPRSWCVWPGAWPPPGPKGFPGGSQGMSKPHFMVTERSLWEPQGERI